MELTIEQLSQYLPYGLKCNHIGVDFSNKTLEVISYSCQTAGFDLRDDEFDYYNLCDIKPILRPMSDLFKEVNYDGSKFEPFYYWFTTQERNLITKYKYSQYTHRMLAILNKNHYDYMGFIKGGLATDINTL